MCGIFGLVEYKNKIINEEDLYFLSSKMNHRGPDDESYHAVDNAGIGMKRLSIIDLENGYQPFFSADAKISLVMNGEIYNYKNLRKDLISKGYIFRSNSDVEVLVFLYQEYGINCVNHINGMFAFALLDLNKKYLWICRDRLGIKPLYYFSNNEKFIFSSELSGIANLVKPKICKNAIMEYFAYSYIPAPKSIYQNIFKVLPGEQIVINLENDKIKKSSYWDVERFEEINSSQKKLDKDLHILLSKTVKDQMMSDVPVGIFLSGGLDSSLIAAYAALETNRPVNTFTIDFKDKNSDDAYYSKILSNHIKSKHTSISLDSKFQLESLDKLVNFMDEPMADSAIVPTYLVSKIARENGIKVMLSGAGGDEIFGGYNRYFPERFLSSAWIANQSQAIRKLFSIILGFINKSYKFRFENAARNYVVNISGINFSFFKENLINKNDFDYMVNHIDHRFKDSNTKNKYKKMYLDMKDYLANNILMLTDQATMANSIEGRVPLLNHEIVEFAFSIDQSKNLINKDGKGILRNIADKVIPNKIIHRKKEGFNAPVNNWLKNWNSEIKTYLFKNKSPILNEIINFDKLNQYFEDESLYKFSASSIYAIYILNKWLNEKKVDLK